MKSNRKTDEPALLMRELINTAAEIYREKGELKAVAVELSLPPNKVKKMLITGKELVYPETEQILNLQKQEKTMAEIGRILGFSYSAIHTYLPYTKVLYKISEISQNAERVKNYKVRKAAVNTLKDSPTEEHLWDCIIAFQNYPFHTISGLPFSYALKVGRNGEYTKELFINRPKGLADVRGISYTFSLFWRFGMIMVSEEAVGKLKGSRK